MSNSENPYVAPTTSDSQLVSSQTPVDFRPIAKAWFNLQGIYNAILIAEVVLVTLFLAPTILGMPQFWFGCVFAGVMANIMFQSGPMIEAYCRVLDAWNERFRNVLFVMGLLFSMLVTLGAIFGQSENLTS
ncbi:MAG: hypothetical protein AAFP90_05830 [Planctomycetota bacterium]